MKIIVPLLAASFLIPAFALAQTRKLPVPAGRPPVPVQHQQQPDRQLEENISISISGDTGSGAPIDIALTGCGPLFRAQISLGQVEIGGEKVPLIGSIDFSASVTDSGYRVEYVISMREPVVSARTAAPTARGLSASSVSFQEKQISGSAKCKPGEGVMIFRSGESQLTLKVDEL